MEYVPASWNFADLTASFKLHHTNSTLRTVKLIYLLGLLVLKHRYQLLESLNFLLLYDLQRLLLLFSDLNLDLPLVICVYSSPRVAP